MRSKFTTALAAVLTLGAIAAASASATLPEFKPAGTSAKPITFTTSGGSSELDLAAFNITCATSSGGGSITSAKGGTATLTFSKCRYSTGASCGTLGQEGGTIKTEPLPFTLVYTEKTPAKEVAIDFGHKASTLMTFYCETAKFVVRSALLAPITPINTLNKSLALTFRVNGEDHQTPNENYTENLEGIEKSFPEVQWEQGPFNLFGLKTTATLTGFRQSGKEGEFKEEIEA